ncbi:MAG: hypothetical protein K6E18_09705 [Lachnospiraceae bacterium]|nr:hypothetical protein [Lachnospiraceae bacterium]
MHLKKATTITMTAISMAMMLTACGSGSSGSLPADESIQDEGTADTGSADTASDSGSVNADINLDALNQSVQAIQDLDLTGNASSDTSTDSQSTAEETDPADAADASADTEAPTEDASESSEQGTPEGDYTPYSYTDVYRNGNDLTVIPNGQLNASTVLFEGKDLGGFLDYVDSTVLEEGRTINRELFYGLLSTMLVDKELSASNPNAIEKYMMMALAIANNFHNLDVSVKDCYLNANNAAEYHYTMKTPERDDIWLINYQDRTIFFNDGNTEYHSDLFKDEYLAVWLMSIEDYYGIKLN